MTRPSERLTSDGSLTIFLFHGVIEAQRHRVRNYTRKHLPAIEFSTMMEELGRKGHPLTMDEVTRICRSGEPFPKGCVCSHL